ncbi:hypothetical protein [Kutzneria buriramensis]|uniref:Uncharacterized protein n=1 Tax=Kutzneria buriramensis TaxID=1045776 RepID=A0A3E0GZY8_9PSEU|nr:hypothetical protein [Kutzneria buriramensis]REH34750.1 hypothetical protein BCF44_11926 [Kutzneria buriramensis]
MPAAPRPVDPVLRALRGCLLAGTSTALTVTAHAAAGGGIPDLGLFLLPTVLLAGAGTLLAERVRGRGVMFAVLGGTQLAVHSLLAMHATSYEMFLAGHAVAGPVPMTIAHVLATAVLAVVLTHADAVLAAVADVLSTVVPRPVPALPAWAPVAVPVTAPCPGTEVMLLLRRVRSRRGPPSDS